MKKNRCLLYFVSLIFLSAFNCFANNFDCNFISDSFYSTYEPDTSEIKNIISVSHGSANVKRHFLMGVYFMHNFEPNQAIFHFQKAQSIDPNFLMSYWGEILAFRYFDGICDSFNLQKKINDIINKINKNKKGQNNQITQKDKMYLNAIKKLKSKNLEQFSYSESQILNSKYSLEMKNIVDKYSDDAYAILLYVDSLLKVRKNNSFEYTKKIGLAINDAIKLDNGALKFFRPYIAMTWNRATNVYNANKFFESIDLEMSPAYLVKSSEYYFNLGDWDSFIKVNKAAWENSKKYVNQYNIPNHLIQYNAAINIIYGMLQLADIDNAFIVLKDMKATIDLRNKCSTSFFVNAMMVFVNNTIDGYKKIYDLLVDVKKEGDTVYTDFLNIFYSIKNNKKIDFDLEIGEFNKKLIKLESQIEKNIGYILKNQLIALFYECTKEYSKAINVIQNAIKIENRSYFSFYHRVLVRPSKEIKGEILFMNGLYGDAYKIFFENVFDMPNRIMTIMGIMASANKIPSNIYNKMSDCYVNNVLQKDIKDDIIGILLDKYNDVMLR